MKADQFSQKTQAKNHQKFLSLLRNKEFVNEIERIRQSWGLPMKDSKELLKDPHSLDQVMQLFLTKHLPNIFLKTKVFSSPDIDYMKVMEIFGVICEYSIRHLSTDTARPSQHDEFLKGDRNIHVDPLFSLIQLLDPTYSSAEASPFPDGFPQEFSQILADLEQDPNRSRVETEVRVLTMLVRFAVDRFTDHVIALLAYMPSGTEWRRTLVAYLLTASEEFALECVPSINADIMNYDKGSLISLEKEHTRSRDLESLYSFLNRQRTTPARHNCPLKNQERDLCNLDKRKTFKTNRQNYDGKSHTSCFEYPTIWGDVGAEHFTRVVNKGRKFSIIANEEEIDRLAECLKRSALRTQKRIEESFNPPITP